VLRDSGLRALLDPSDEKGGALVQVDDYLFTPCGYSLNAIVREKYYVTIHITPEDDFSYASYETNAPVEYEGLLGKVLSVFQPKSCTVALFSDSKQPECLNVCEEMGYHRVSHESARIQRSFFAEMSSFSKV
jgi:hypothetical protein